MFSKIIQIQTHLHIQTATNCWDFGIPSVLLQIHLLDISLLDIINRTAHQAKPHKYSIAITIRIRFRQCIRNAISVPNNRISKKIAALGETHLMESCRKDGRLPSRTSLPISSYQSINHRIPGTLDSRKQHKIEIENDLDLWMDWVSLAK